MTSFEEYVREHWTDGNEPDFRGMAIMACGVAGETGEVLEHFKKVIRNFDGDFAAYPHRDKALLEMGDALHYFVRIAQCFDFSLLEIMQANMEKLDKRRAENPTWAAGADGHTK